MKASRQCKFIARTAALFCSAAVAACTGLTGNVYERLPNNAIGPVIPGATLEFIREDGSAVFTTQSDTAGHYSINLNTGRYYWRVTHQNHSDDTSAPGFAVVNSGNKGIANIFLRAPDVTTVIVVRHAEKLDPNSNLATEPLSPDGEIRAQMLREVLHRAGVTAVYSTDTVRTRATVGELADFFHIPTQIYSNVTTLASTVLAQNQGDTVLVAAHSNTVGSVANAFGAQVPTADIVDFDNLYVISVQGSRTNVVNLQYGVNSTTDLTKNDPDAMTLLLVGTTSSGTDAQDLLHAARKAGVSDIFSTAAANSLVSPLATQLGLTLQTFNGSTAADAAAFVTQLVANHATDTLVVAGTGDELRELIRALGAAPFPIIYTTDTDHLVVVTRFPSGAARVTALRF